MLRRLSTSALINLGRISRRNSDERVDKSGARETGQKPLANNQKSLNQIMLLSKFPQHRKQIRPFQGKAAALRRMNQAEEGVFFVQYQADLSTASKDTQYLSGLSLRNTLARKLAVFLRRVISHFAYVGALAAQIDSDHATRVQIAC